MKTTTKLYLMLPFLFFSILKLEGQNKVLLTAAVDYTTGLGSDIEDLQDKFILPNIGIETMLNHDLAMSLKIGFYIPRTESYNYSAPIGDDRVLYENLEESSSAFTIDLQPFKYYFSQRMDGLYLSPRVQMFLASNSRDGIRYELPGNVNLDQYSYEYSEVEFMTGLIIGLKKNLANGSLLLDFSSSLLDSQGDSGFDPILSFSIGIGYFLK